MRAIETEYGGRMYRSRTEARWAVVWDEVGLDYDYEPQGYNLRGHRYLPDFWLKDPHWWVEIKGRPPSAGDRRLARLLMLESGCNTYIFCGQPATVRDGGFAVWAYPALEPPQANERGQRVLDRLSRLMGIIEAGICVTPETEEQELEARMLRWKWMGHFDHALDAGRAARFEHGQKGAPRRWLAEKTMP